VPNSHKTVVLEAFWFVSVSQIVVSGVRFLANFTVVLGYPTLSQLLTVALVAVWTGVKEVIVVTHKTYCFSRHFLRRIYHCFGGTISFPNHKPLSWLYLHTFIPWTIMFCCKTRYYCLQNPLFLTTLFGPLGVPYPFLTVNRYLACPTIKCCLGAVWMV
jgi:hypothetical protein